MNEYMNPPCNSSSATSLINGMSSLEEIKVGRTSPFAESDEVVEEGALEIDEGVVERISSLDPPFVLSFAAAEKEWKQCARRALEQLGGEVISGTEPVFDADDEGEDTFVEVVGGGQRDEGEQSEGFTFVDAFMRANLLSETLLEGVVSSSELPLC